MAFGVVQPILLFLVQIQARGSATVEVFWGAVGVGGALPGDLGCLEKFGGGGLLAGLGQWFSVKSGGGWSFGGPIVADQAFDSEREVLEVAGQGTTGVLI